MHTKNHATQQDDVLLSFVYWTSASVKPAEDQQIGRKIVAPTDIILNRNQFTKIQLKLLKADMKYFFQIKKDDGILEDALSYQVPCPPKDVLAVGVKLVRISDDIPKVVLKNVKFTTANCASKKFWNAESGVCEQAAGPAGRGEC